VFLPFHQQLLALAVDVFVVLVVDLGAKWVEIDFIDCHGKKVSIFM
jgi:hypothetical protein